MSGPIVRLYGHQFEEAMAFLNRCFGESQPMDFANMLPSLYQPIDEMMRNNYAIIEDGRIVSMAGAFPIKLRIGDVELRMAGIGGVSVAPEQRGRGLMIRLMDHVRGEILRGGYDLSYLGGARQRYRHFGWEVTGTETWLDLGKTAAQSAANTELTIESAPMDRATLAELKALHDAQPIFCVRTLDVFERFLRCWQHRPFIARRAGNIVGYLVASDKDGRVVEIVVKNAAELAELACAWAFKAGRPTRIGLRALPSLALFELAEVADSIALRASGNWQIFNYAKVVDALLRLKHRFSPLPVGEVSLGVTGQAQSLHLEVRASSAGCALRDHPAPFSVEPMLLSRILFGPQPTDLTSTLPKSAEPLRAWCPLPLGFSEQDRV